MQSNEAEYFSASLDEFLLLIFPGQMMNNTNIHEITKNIQNIIDSNKSFYFFDNKIEWEFFEDSNLSKFAYVDRTLKLHLNINSILRSYDINQPLWIEHFIFHEIRHIYQRRLIIKYNFGEIPHNTMEAETVEQYQYEFDNYIDLNNDKIGYYSQLIEIEAFTFAYAAMYYKYGTIDYIKLPPLLQESQISQIADKFIKSFLSAFNEKRC